MINACGNACSADYANLVSTSPFHSHATAHQLPDYQHWYGINVAQFQDYITAAHNRFPQFKIVVTEFALTNPPGGQADQIVSSPVLVQALPSMPFPHVVP